jgi:recombination protein U
MSTISGRGKALEGLIDSSNAVYFNRGIAFIDRLETSTAKRTEAPVGGGKPTLKVVAYQAKPRLDYRGLFYGGAGFDFDAKETADYQGLPLKDIRQNQIDFLRIAKALNLTAFLVVYSSARNQHYRADCRDVLEYWDIHIRFPGRRGTCRVPFGCMTRIAMSEGIPLDYLKGLYLPAGPHADMDAYAKEKYYDERAGRK